MAGDPTHTSRYNAIVDLLHRQAADDAAVTSAMRRARELRDRDMAESMLDLEDAQLAQLGWTRQELIVARDARASKQHVPYYLTAHQERHTARLRAATEQADDITSKQALGYVLVVPEKRKLSAIDIEGVEPEEP